MDRIAVIWATAASGCAVLAMLVCVQQRRRLARLAGELKSRGDQDHENRRQMELTTDVPELGLWRWDIERDDIWMNETGRNLLGFAPGEQLNLERFMVVMHPDDRLGARRSVEESVRKGVSLDIEYRLQPHNGRPRWIAAHGRVERIDGRAVRVRGISMDVSSRREGEERVRLVFDAAPNAMIMADDRGRITMVNARVEHVFGYGRDELLGRQVEMLLPERFRDGHDAHRRSYFSAPEARAMGAGRELRGRHKNGSEIPVEIGLNPIHIGDRFFVLASIIDITARIKADQEAARQHNEVAHLSRVTMLGELSGSLAHELNQPLASILSNAQAAQRLMNREPVDLSEVREILADIVEQDKRAGDIIRRLRLLLKKSDPDYRTLDVNELVDDVLRLMRSDLLNQGVQVDTDLDQNIPPVRGDRVQLQQVLLNLVMNGCDAMADQEPGLRRMLIRTRSSSGGHVLVSVADRGHGIAPEHINRVFEPFFTTKPRGMGLGLAVCRTIMSAHNGYLSAANNPDHGSTLDFVLPAAKEAQP